MYNKDLNTLNALIDSSISEAYNNINNNLLSDTRFFLNHFDIETGNLLLDELNRLMLSMKNQPLPIDRVEFENRAILFLCLTELKQFLVNRKHAQMLRDNNFYK